MRFVLRAEALDGDDALLTLIDRLVDRAADEVHRVEVPDADLLQDSRWYQTARPTRRKVLTSAVASPPRQRAASRGPHAKHEDVRTLDDATRADKLAHTALIVLVEDREADGVLLDILVEELGSPELAALWARGKTVTPRAVELDSAGGITAMPQRIQRAVDDANSEGRPVRLFVLCDSDVRWPGDTQSENPVQAVFDTCTEHGIPHHVLQKRNAENYIPDEVFEAVRDDLRRVNDVDRFNALLRRSRAQRDHFPVKDGMKPSERDGAIAAGLYDTSEQGDLALLEERLLPKRPRPMLLLYTERRAAFTAAGLSARAGNDEIDKLLAALAGEL